MRRIVARRLAELTLRQRLRVFRRARRHRPVVVSVSTPLAVLNEALIVLVVPSLFAKVSIVVLPLKSRISPFWYLCARRRLTRWG